MAQREDSRQQSEPAPNGATLRAAGAWVLDTQSFAALPVHGNRWTIHVVRATFQ